jgi:micrococcal nuclease
MWRARQSGLCFKRWASITPASRDRYGRTVGRVQCQGRDSSAEQVRAGMAWAFKRYLTDPEIARLEEAARKAGLGLWRDTDPVAPWDWRTAH